MVEKSFDPSKDVVFVAGERIFIIDDNIDFLEMCSKRLEHEGYQVCSFGNAHEAIKAIRIQKPDLVISDIKMPGLNGIEVCDLLGSNAYTRHIPIILMTGFFEKQAHIESLNIKPLFLLKKPFGAKDLLTTVRAAIDSSYDCEEHLAAS